MDVGALEPLERSGQHHWKEATITDPDLGSRSNVFFAAVEMTRMPMILTDPNQPDDPIVFANGAFLDLTGYSEAEVLGRNCRFLQGAQTDPETVAELRDGIREHRAVSVEILNYKRDGTPFWNAVFVGPVYGDKGELLYFFASQLDVTRRRNSEQNFRQAQKMEAIGQLTAGLAHDFNNLLQVVSGNLEMLRGRVNDTRAERYLDNAAAAADRGARLTRQLLAFARKTRLDPQTIDLSVLVNGIEEMIETTLGGKIDLHFSLRRRLPKAVADPTHLEMALLNVLINARDAMPDGGLVTISTGSLATDPAARGLPPGEYVVLCVEDDGQGMPPHVLERAAEPFFTTKSAGKGTGLGLAMVSGFVQQSKGKLEIESELGRGTIVRMIFPVGQSEALAPEPRFVPQAARVSSESAAHILVVEDTPEVLELALEILSGLGYRVSTATNGEDGLKVFQRMMNEAPVDLLFTDLVMPGGINGIVLAEEVLKLAPETAVLLTTGYNEELTVNGPPRPGLDVIGKPYRRTELGDRVRQALGRRSTAPDERSPSEIGPAEA
ncbi:hybrid sensor histidine kinase/response regulator [Phenylobacterium deserti]|uniref:histidine kinase n=1 Tax=Phenylobacterium deserti TaxID=1914756 RepID=A0A328AVP9_9CAUL|nr:hybrid sensor histidine kinase/response regulator [Phenylobacterium deserti]